MDRRKTERLGDTLRLFWKDHPDMYHQMMEARVQRLWGELLGPTIARYTTHVCVKNRTLYVSIASSVVRSELITMRKRLVTTLNEHAGGDVIDDVMIR